MFSRLAGWLAAAAAMLIAAALIAGELASAGQRRWWAARPLTTDTVAGLAVLLITVLVVNQVLSLRQSRQRGHAVAAQAAIMVAQANRSAKAVSALADGTGEHDAAADGFRVYMLTLLVGAPVLIADPAARRFLEQAQYLGAVLAGALAALDRRPGATPAPGGVAQGHGAGDAVQGDTASDAVPGEPAGGAVRDVKADGVVQGDRVGEALRQLQATAAPFLQLLHPAVRETLQGISRTAEQ